MFDILIAELRNELKELRTALHRRHDRFTDQIHEIYVHLHRQESRMSAASDALMKALTDLSAKLAPAISDIKAQNAAAVAAQAAQDDAAFKQATDTVNAMLDQLVPHADAVVQLAGAVADGSGTAKPVATVTPDVATADPVPAAPSTSADAAAAAPASSSDAPASDEVTGDHADH
ncbi:hypothetical protein [Methylobacterium sp. B1]|uniref:hypothetical protein n=1 Tax=Methylobacterium sp. B1 TaxID=91459 RepID=UPI000349FF3D|nr:hypothetical protein [Methylobacterium sp. B1]